MDTTNTATKKSYTDGLRAALEMIEYRISLKTRAMRGEKKKTQVAKLQAQIDTLRSVERSINDELEDAGQGPTDELIEQIERSARANASADHAPDSEE